MWKSKLILFLIVIFSTFEGAFNNHCPSQTDFECISGPCLIEKRICDGWKDCPKGDDEQSCCYHSEYACDYKTLTVDCSKQGNGTHDSVIKVVRGNFGRTDSERCLYKYKDMFVRCYSRSSNDAVKKLCDGKPSCTLTASCAFFGDPCAIYDKFLEVHYNCVAVRKRN